MSYESLKFYRKLLFLFKSVLTLGYVSAAGFFLSLFKMLFNGSVETNAIVERCEPPDFSF